MKKLFKDITLIFRVKKAVKQAKKSIDKNKGVAEDIKNKVANLKLAIEDLLYSLPMLKPLYTDVVDIIKRYWK